MSNYIVSDTSLGSVADAIRTKGGTSAPLEYPQGFIDAIDDIETGGGTPTIQSLTVTENGTYTAPTGVDGYSPVTVNVSGGDTPIPDDGKTRIFIHIADDTPDNRLTFYLRFMASMANNTTVDWGDGVSETLGSTTATNYSHKYSQGGDYVITMTVNSGSINFDGDNNNAIYGARSTDNYINRARIRKIIFGNSIREITSYVLNGCYGLSDVAFMSGASMSSYSKYVFGYCYNLKNITLPSSLRTIPEYAFQACFSLYSLTIPKRVNIIDNYAFINCYSVSEYHFESTTPPTLANANAFTGIASDCKIYVPKGSLSAYQQATNWSSLASKIQEEPA